MPAALVVLAMTLTPTPADVIRADTLLRQPADAPADPDRSPAFRRALLTVMLREGAVDPGVEGRWWPPDFEAGTHLALARRLVARVQTCPPLAAGWHVPPPAWFAAEARAHRGEAAARRELAGHYREQAAWDTDRRAAFEGWSRALDAEADQLDHIAGRMDSWAEPGMTRPRRLVLAEVAAEWPGRWAPPERLKRGPGAGKGDGR